MLAYRAFIGVLQMTTIVYRDGIIAADSRAWAGNRNNIGTKTKLHKVKGGVIGISSSTIGMPEAFLQHVNEDKETLWLPEVWHVEAIYIYKGQLLFWNDGQSFTGPLTAEWLAIGSGAQYAIGALRMGASAVKAVEVACLEDYVTGPPIISMRVKVNGGHSSGKPRKASSNRG